MNKLKLKTFTLECQVCHKSIPIHPDEFKIGKTKTCPHCKKFTMEFTDDLREKIMKSLKKTLSILK